ncbi:magnesium chelatase domain-containing protein [Prolixibacteraceae bacterium]|nr:magnesium chelatase domain-containing protein [Prolixibacteraceae bacterium]
MVGLPDNAEKESQQRIEAALRYHGLKTQGKKIVINMAPEDLRKEGASYDLPIAIGILAASVWILAPSLDKYYHYRRTYLLPSKHVKRDSMDSFYL